MHYLEFPESGAEVGAEPNKRKRSPGRPCYGLLEIWPRQRTATSTNADAKSFASYSARDHAVSMVSKNPVPIPAVPSNI
jgi:hypothetical protein